MQAPDYPPPGDAHDPRLYRSSDVYRPAVEAPAGGLMVASLVCGIVGVVFGMIPLAFLFAWALGLVAIVLGLVARHRRHGTAKYTMALWGTWLGVAAFLLGVLGFAIVNSAFEDLESDLEGIESETP